MEQLLGYIRRTLAAALYLLLFRTEAEEPGTDKPEMDIL